MNLCIVGGGASGIILLHQLINKLSHIDDKKIKNIFIIDKDDFSGGLAYKTVNDHHILNMHASLMSGVSQDKDHFVNWILSTYPSIMNDGYLPRNMYGKYLNKLLTASVAWHDSVRIHIINETVINITADKSRNYYIELSNKSTLEANVCILCIGHSAPADIYNLARYARFINEPYANEAVDFTNCSVGLLGCGLTAVDKALEINAKYKDVKILCFSRSGIFPKVQPVHNSIISNNNPFRADLLNYVNSTDYITIDSLIQHIEKKLVTYCAESIRFGELKNDKCGHSLLKADIDKSISSTTNSYNYLVSISDIIGIAWNKMDVGQKIIFKEKYLSGWMRYRHAMPLKNGLSLINLLNTNILNTYAIDGSAGSIIFNNKFEVEILNKCKVECDYIINCTGSSDTTHINNVLVNRLLESGLVSKNKYYGINCSYSTNNILDQKGNVVDNLFVIGDITKGTHFFVNGIEHVLDRARVISDKIIESLK